MTSVIEEASRNSLFLCMIFAAKCNRNNYNAWYLLNYKTVQKLESNVDGWVS